MKKNVWLLCTSVLLSACASKTPLPDLTLCTDPRPQICTMEYIPVCGLRQDDSVGGYPSACSACADDNVTGWAPGECTSGNLRDLN
jgi:hypothetical protein